MRIVLLGGVGRTGGGREVRSICILLVRDNVVDAGRGAEHGDAMIGDGLLFDGRRMRRRKR